jgi:nitrous oxidase accessory protein NosD
LAKDSVQVPWESKGIGLVLAESGIVTVLGSNVSQNSYVGVVIEGAAQGRLGNTDVTGDQIGVATQGGGTFVDLGGNNISGNTQDFLGDGDLPVPSAPDVPPE